MTVAEDYQYVLYRRLCGGEGLSDDRHRAPWFASANVHLIPILESAVRHMRRDERALIALRAESEARIDFAILRLKRLGMTVSLNHSDADFLTGVSIGQVNRAKPV